MTKIMLVEDDNNLREIYEARLAAEGYTIVSAQDGEAALALAAKERPDLVITDVMMPKISGFEMLDILRNTENLRDVKVIMLTALGQAEDNARANALGADRYLVKSQVTLEDIVKTTHDLLDDPATDAPGQGVTTETASPVAAPATAPTETAETATDVSSETAASQSEVSTPVESIPVAVQMPVAVEALPSLEPAAPVAVAPGYEAAIPAPAASPEIQSEPSSSTVPADAPALDGAADRIAVVAPTSDLPTNDLTSDAPATQTEPAAPVMPPNEPPASDLTTLDLPAPDAASADTTVAQDNLPSSADQPIIDQPVVDQPAVDQTTDDNQQAMSADQPAWSSETASAERLTPEAAAAQPEIAAAAPAAEEESAVRQQIDQFLETVPTEEPEAGPAPENAVPPTSDSAAVDQPQDNPALSSDQEVAQYHLQPVDDQSESDYQKDDSTPDMGELSVHAEPAPVSEAAETSQTQTPEAPQTYQTSEAPQAYLTPPASDAANQVTAAPQPAASYEPVTAPEPAPIDTDDTSSDVASATDPSAPTLPHPTEHPVFPPANDGMTATAPAGYPSQPFQMPMTPPAAEYSAPADQSSGDKVVSDAVNDMIASTMPGQLADQSAVAGTLSANPAADLPTDVPQGPPRKKVISPLTEGVNRPDIHQLLAAEEAKNAAVQAGMAQQAGFVSGAAPAAAPPVFGQVPQAPSPDATDLPWQPLPVQEQPKPDRYGPGIDPNSISL